MRAAFAAFRARWPWVTAFGTWNEGNHASQPSADDPAGTARLYETLAAACPDCPILAVELLDSPNMLSWLRRFRAGLSSEPRLWGLHNYSDVTRGSTAMTEALLAAGRRRGLDHGDGGLVRQLGRWPYDEERARASIARASQLAEAHADRIERMFIYQWQAAAHEPWDSGLMPPGLLAAPELHRARRVAAPAGPPPLSVLPPTAHAGTCADHAPARAPPVVRRAGIVRARVYARRPRRGPCVVPARAIRGRGADTARVRPGAHATLAVRLPARTRRAIRLRRTTRVTAEIRSLRARFVVRCRPVRRAAVAIVATAVAARLVYGRGTLGYDAAWALVWGNELFDGPALDAPGAPTPHPLAILVSAVIAPLGEAGHRSGARALLARVRRRRLVRLPARRRALLAVGRRPVRGAAADAPATGPRGRPGGDRHPVPGTRARGDDRRGAEPPRPGMRSRCSSASPGCCGPRRGCSPLRGPPGRANPRPRSRSPRRCCGSRSTSPRPAIRCTPCTARRRSPPSSSARANSRRRCERRRATCAPRSPSR